MMFCGQHDCNYLKSKQLKQPNPSNLNGKKKKKFSLKIQLKRPEVANFTGHLKGRIKRCQKLSIVIIFSWLLINTDPVYMRRTIAGMMASRFVARSLLNPVGGATSGAAIAPQFSQGINLVEAIALIQALNNNNNNNNNNLQNNRLNDLKTLKTELELKRELRKENNEGSNVNRAAQNTGRDVVTSRQATPTPTPTAIAAILAAAAAAFLAAIASGATPFAAVAAFFAAAAAAAIAALLALLGINKKNDKQFPFIKKLIIKKTVLPFVIPIPIPIKKKEKEIVYVHKKEPHHYHHYEHHHKKKKYKKADLDEDYNEWQPNQKHNIVADGMINNKNTHLDQIESLLNEQEQLQTIVNKVVEP